MIYAAILGTLVVLFVVAFVSFAAGAVYSLSQRDARDADRDEAFIALQGDSDIFHHFAALSRFHRVAFVCAAAKTLDVVDRAEVRAALSKTTTPTRGPGPGSES